MRIRNTGHRILACRKCFFFHLYVVPTVRRTALVDENTKTKTVAWFQMNQMSLCFALSDFRAADVTINRG